MLLLHYLLTPSSSVYSSLEGPAAAVELELLLLLRLLLPLLLRLLLPLLQLQLLCSCYCPRY